MWKVHVNIILHEPINMLLLYNFLCGMIFQVNLNGKRIKR